MSIAFRWLILSGALALILAFAALAARSSGRVVSSPTISTTQPATIPLGWPNFLGPERNSVSGETQLLDHFPEQGPAVLWRRAVGTGYSSPVVTDAGLLLFYRRANEEVVECLGPNSGATRWQFAYPTAYKCKYEYSDGPYSTPTIAGEYVYALGAEGKLHCLAMADGALLWQRDLKADYDLAEQLFAVGVSPLVDAKRIYLPIGGRREHSGIIALDKQTGTTLWTATDHEAGYASPIQATIHGREYLFVFNRYGLVALDPATGEVYWETPFASRGVDTVCASSPVVENDLVLITMGPAPGALCVRVLPDGSFEEVWRDRRAIDSTWNNVALVAGQVYGFTSKRQRTKLRSLELKTGKVCWEWESDLERGSLIAADGKLIAWGEHGHLALLDLSPHQFQLQAMTSEPLLDTPCYAMPALHRGRLYLRNNQELICLDLRESPGERE
jgi:outer membrane protein assembly factor BamB